MTFSLCWMRFLCIIALMFPLYSDTSFSRAVRPREGRMDCSVYETHLYACTRQYDPVCGSDGRTYSNECIFCSHKLDGQGDLKVTQYGHC